MPTLKLDKISTTLSRKKYVEPPVPYTEFNTALYFDQLNISVSLSFCGTLARDEEFLSCVEFHLTPTHPDINPIDSVFRSVLRSGDIITMVMETYRPVVGDVRPKMEYTQENYHYRCPLPDIRIELPDLPSPLPTANFAPGLLFDKLWEFCEDNQRSHKAGEAFVSKIKPGEGFRINFNMFRLPERSKSDKNVCYMFGLPPNHFVLVLCVPEFSTMKIAMDSWKIFPVVYSLITENVEG